MDIPHTPYEAALVYRRLNWVIIPVRMNKHAACQWKEYQERQPTEYEMKRLFAARGITGVAVVLGPVSGGLYGRDFDTPEAYQRWAAAYPGFAGTLPTVQTHRGRHVYANWRDGIKTAHFTDGELRGNGTYLLLPPSMHPEGGRYVWLIPPDANGISVSTPPDMLGLDREWVATAEGHPGESETRVAIKGPVLSLAGWDHTDAGLIRLALPDAARQNNRMLFRLARAVKAAEESEGRKWGEDEMIERVFDKWYASNQYLRDGTSREVYVQEFLRAYDTAKVPLDQSPLHVAWRRASERPTPRAADRFQDEDFRRLAGWCRELQRLHKDEPFFLSMRDIQLMFGHPTHRRAQLMMYALCRAGILRLVEKGSRGSGLASTYFYLAPLHDPEEIEASDGRIALAGQ